MMKNYLLLMLAVIGFASCKKETDPAVQPVDLDVTISYAAKFAAYTFPMSDVSLTITNLRNSKVQEGKTTANGTYTFPSASAGSYDIDATITITAAQYEQITGIETDADVVFQASIKNKLINQAIGGEVALELTSGRIGNWLIKQVNYGGSHRTNGALFRDQFMEICNNSSDTLYADSLYIADVFNSTSPTPDQSKGYYLPGGQLDWTKSAGMPAGINANDDFLYAKSLYRIPGNGRTYPVAPGKSIVIAQNALNHKAPFTNGNGVVVTVIDPSLTIDLSIANFEVFLGKGFASDIDVAGVPNMEIISSNGNDWVLDNTGRNAWVIFQTSQNAKDWAAYPDPSATAGATTMYIQMPKSMVIDGVETQPGLVGQVPKKLDNNLDAGFTYLPKGPYTSQAVIRKVAKTVGTRKILQDTNNSSNDFENIDLSVPFGFK
jgi:hypothetical protein